VQPDEPGKPDQTGGGSSAADEGWSVEDFDDFEAFDLDEPTVPPLSRDDDVAQSTFDLASDEFASGGEADAELPDGAELRDDTESSAQIAASATSTTASDSTTPSVPPQPAAAPVAPARPSVVRVSAEASDTADDAVETAFEGGEAGSADVVEDEGAVGVPEFASFTSDDEFASFTSEHYMQATTQEFVDLASDMARMSAEEQVPSAVAAEMPGLRVGVVGLDDVVAASGEDPAIVDPRKKSDLAIRVFTGVGLAVIFFVSLYAPLLVGFFVLLILLIASVEFYGTLVRAGYRPLGLFGLLGTAGALVGTWIWGPVAVPVVIAATLVASLLFFGIVAGRRGTFTNAAMTLLGVAWIGGLGAFIFDMARSDLYGWLIAATVVTVSVMDVAQYFFGRRVGRLRLAPRLSPNKTVEGLVGGVLVALLVGVIFGLLSSKVGFVDVKSPIDLGAGLALGLAVAIAAPFGDLAVSLLKRSIGVKDMGTVLPGHGGLLDRIDAMLFAIPLAWIVFVWAGLLA
jgi:phosphatidate cytidylyltransferase